MRGKSTLDNSPHTSTENLKVITELRVKAKAVIRDMEDPKYRKTLIWANPASSMKYFILCLLLEEDKTFTTV